MLLDVINAKCMYEEYERRMKAELLVRTALKARAEHTAATARPLNQGFCLLVNLPATLWHWGQRIVRHRSGQPEAILPNPMKHQL